MPTISRTFEKLRDPEYRKAFVSSQINIGIPFQIRALLRSRGKTQAWLAENTGMLQPRISGLMTPGKTRPNIETLRRVAEAFDCGLAVRFVPFTELVRWSDKFDPEKLTVPDFTAELSATAERERATATAFGLDRISGIPSAIQHEIASFGSLKAKMGPFFASGGIQAVEFTNPLGKCFQEGIAIGEIGKLMRLASGVAKRESAIELTQAQNSSTGRGPSLVLLRPAPPGPVTSIDKYRAPRRQREARPSTGKKSNRRRYA